MISAYTRTTPDIDGGDECFRIVAHSAVVRASVSVGVRA
jgi:hypothetical protein